MTPEVVMDLFSEALYLTVLMVLVIVGPSLIVGLLVSMFQAATQINEMTLSFIPKLLVTFATLWIAGPYMLNMLVEYIHRTFTDIPYLVVEALQVLDVHCRQNIDTSF